MIENILQFMDSCIQNYDEEITNFFQSKKMCLNKAHADMLNCLQHYGMMSQQELSDKLSIDYPFTKRLIISLLNYEFVSAVRNPNEKRNNLIRLTNAGEALLLCLYETIPANSLDILKFPDL